MTDENSAKTVAIIGAGIGGLYLVAELGIAGFKLRPGPPPCPGIVRFSGSRAIGKHCDPVPIGERSGKSLGQAPLPAFWRCSMGIFCFPECPNCRQLDCAPVDFDDVCPLFTGR